VLLHNGSATMSPGDANTLQPINNDFLTYVSEAGLVGVALAVPLVWLIVRALRATVRARLDHPAAPYAFALVGMALEGSVFQSLLLLRTWVVIGLLLAAARIANERDGAGQIERAVLWRRTAYRPTHRAESARTAAR
jgi:hypothetical protein